MVDLVGSGDHGCHSVLVSRRDDGQERESGQRQVVHAAGHAALIIAVWVQTSVMGGTKERGMKRQRMKRRVSSFLFQQLSLSLVLSLHDVGHQFYLYSFVRRDEG